MNQTIPEAAQPSLGRTRQSVRPAWERWTPAAAALLALFYLITSLQIAAHRLLWSDEIVTYLIAQLPGASQIVHALAHVDNNMPAPYFLVVHWFFKILGDGPVVARLPSALAMSAALFIVFDCARRLTDGLHGLIAASVLGSSCLPYYGYETRSYGIYFMLAAVAYWIWTNTKRTITSAVLFGAVISLAVLFHYYAVLILVPYALWEARVWKPWRAPSAKLSAGALGVCCSAAALLPQIFGAKRYSGTFWSPPTLFRLRTSLGDFFPDGVFLLALILIWIALASRPGQKSAVTSMEAPECIGWFHLLIPFAGYAVALLITKAYVSRYFLCLLPGVAVAFSCWLWRRFSNMRAVSTGVLFILAFYAVFMQLQTVRHPQSIDPFHQQTDTRQALEIESKLRAEGKRFTVVTAGMLYLELRFYAKDPEEYVLLTPSPNYVPTVRIVAGLGRYYPMHFWNLDDLRQHSTEAALLVSTQDLKTLNDAGFITVRRFTTPMEVDYIQ